MSALHLILAMDGLRGPSPKHYTENLLIPTDDNSLLKTLHVRAVREVYRHHPQVTPDIFAKVLRKLFFIDDSDHFKELEHAIKNCYLDALGDSRDAVLEWKKLKYKHEQTLAIIRELLPEKNQPRENETKEGKVKKFSRKSIYRRI